MLLIDVDCNDLSKSVIFMFNIMFVAIPFQILSKGIWVHVEFINCGVVTAKAKIATQMTVYQSQK